jgi:GNAT superfamily N-acetyltransferase
MATNEADNRGGNDIVNPFLFDNIARIDPIKIIICEAKVKDTAIIAQFNARLAWETERRRLGRSRLTAGVKALLSDSAKGTYFVARIGDSVAGQLLITYEWSDWRNGNFWWLQSVYVARRYRGQGVFRALFKHVERLARAEGNVCGIRLYMEQENARARKVYSDLGLRETNYQVFELEWRKAK